MANLQLSKHVNAPAAVVFQVAADIPRWADAIRAITRIEMLTDGPVGLGARFRETRTMFGRQASETMEVVGFDPPRAFTLGAESCGSWFESEHQFTPDISGTLVTLTIRTKPRTLLARLCAPVGWLMMGSMKKLVAADLDDLKAAAELRSGAPAHAPGDPGPGYEMLQA